MSLEPDLSSTPIGTVEGVAKGCSYPAGKNAREVARDSLGIKAAFVLLPALFPDGWGQYPELSSDVYITPDDLTFAPASIVAT